MSLPQGFLPFDSNKDSTKDSSRLEANDEETSGGGVLLVRNRVQWVRCDDAFPFDRSRVQPVNACS